MLVMVILVRLVVPDLPSWLATEMAKVEFQRREASRSMHTPSQVIINKLDSISFHDYLIQLMFEGYSYIKKYRDYVDEFRCKILVKIRTL